MEPELHETDETDPADAWLEYGRRKRGLPALTPEEYTMAVTKIAEDLGI